jgi:hypothetical protein
LIGLTLTAILSAGFWASGGTTTAPASTDSVATLRAAALNDDFDKSISALHQLSNVGAGASQTIHEIVPQLLTRDSATIESESSAVAAELAKVKSVEAEIQPLRDQSLAAIENLTLDPQSLKTARKNYARLSNTAARLTPLYTKRLHIVQAWSRRTECLSLVPSAKTADAGQLSKLADGALGMSAEAACKFLLGPLDPPAEAGERPLWFFIACRRIDAWNRQIEPAMNPAEATHFRLLNSYRELLGLLPFELDTRLVQAARLHSKEMMDLWYFSHYSPIASERGPGDRMAMAGYADGSNENITMGSWTGEDAFWQLFNSPDHHRAWVNRNDTTLGVGKWEFGWTEDIGAGHRLMTAPDAERTAAVGQGAELKPQTTETTRKHPRDLATIKFYDEAGQEVKTLPPGVEKKVSTRER